MKDQTQAGTVETHIDAAGIASITFFHPAHNSLPGRLLERLAQSIRQCGENEAVKVIVLRSGGERTFCAGASFDELVRINSPRAGKQFFMGFAHVINACRTCPKFVIGRVQGKAVGGGVGLAAAVDYCLATQYASVKLSELAIGLGPFVVGPAVERKIGLAAFSQLAINASQWQSAHWAQEKGLYAGVYEDTAGLDAAVDALAASLASYNPEAMKKLKEVLWEGTAHWRELLEKRAEISGQLVLSDHTREALERFGKKG